VVVEMTFPGMPPLTMNGVEATTLLFGRTAGPLSRLDNPRRTP
jgi:hypothetical protein